MKNIYIFLIVKALKGTHHEKILDFREPQYGAKRQSAFCVISSRSFLLNAEMSVDEDVFYTLQERPLHKTLQDKMQLRADVMSWFCRGGQKGSLRR